MPDLSRCSVHLIRCTAVALLLSLLSTVAVCQEDTKPAEPSPEKNEAAAEKRIRDTLEAADQAKADADAAIATQEKDEAAGEPAAKDPEEEDFRFAGIKIPAPPDEDYPTADYAELLDEAQEKELHQVQLASYHEQNTPIVVVTINSMREYGPKDWSIERFGYTWFNKWEIGKRGEEGELINRGILLLVSVGDRKARIELGADWGRDWDRHCSVIMNSKIVPRFKKGDFAGGIEAGVQALAEMAGTPPGQAAPRSSSGRSYRSSRSSGQTLPSLPTGLIIICVIVGIALIGLSFKYPKNQKGLLIAGVVLIAAGLLTYIIVLALFLFMGMKGGRGGGGGGGWSGGGGGGFSSGGFSGGGGASGSW